MPRVSIVLPTYNRLKQLSLVLAALGKQTYPVENWEVVVISDGSTDGTNDYLKSIRTPFALKTVFQSNSGVASARNAGIAAADGEIILFLDDDVIPIPQFIAEHARMHPTQDSGNVIIGPMLTPANFPLSPWVRWSQERLAEQYQSMSSGSWSPTARQFYTGNCSMARSPLVDCGGFDPAFRRAEDVELAFRLQQRGLCFLYNPDAIGYHHEERSFEAWKEISYHYGRNDVIFTYQKGQTWLLEIVFQEYHARHPLIRAVTWLCLDRKRISHIFTRTMEQMMKRGNWAKNNLLQRMACSMVSNLSYYQGVADELGGGERFFSQNRRGENSG